jgi:hypothetical protein
MLLSDYPGRTRIVVECEVCQRSGSYSIVRLMQTHGDIAILDLRAELESTCQRARTPSLDNRCRPVTTPE